VVLRLLDSADVLVESFAPGKLEALGLGYEALRTRNPRLIITSVTGFGQTGPYAGWQWSDLVACAMGGLVAITGEPGRAPLRAKVSPSFTVASIFAGIGILAALNQRERTGKGQVIDVSLQAAVAAVLEFVSTFYETAREVIPRNGNQHPTVCPNR